MADPLTLAAAIIGTGIALAAPNVALFAWIKSGLTGFLKGLGLTGRAAPIPEAG